MDKKNVSKAPVSRKALMVIIALVTIMTVLIIVALSSGNSREVVIKDFGFAFSNTGRFVRIMRVPGAQADISEIVNALSPDEKIEIKDESPSYKGEALSSEIPAFFNNKGYIYIPWEEAVFLGSDLKLRSYEGRTFLIKDSFFNEDYTRRSDAKGLLLLSCTKNLFLALDGFRVTSGGDEFEVLPMELVLFDGYNLRTAAVSETVAEREAHGIGKDSLVTIKDHTYMMEDFLGVLGLSVERDSTVGGLDRLKLSEEDEEEKHEDGEEKNGAVTRKAPPVSIEDSVLKIKEESFQYCLGYRYDYPEDFEVFCHDGIWYQKRDGFVSQMEKGPIYSREKMFLPDEYILVDSKSNRIAWIPAFSQVINEKRENGRFLISSKDGKEEKSVPRSVIYDGENYIFTDEVTISWKDASYTLAPFSYVSYDGNEILEFYDYGEDIFRTFILQVDSAEVRYDDGSGVDVIKRIIFDENGNKQMMFDDASIFGSVFESDIW